MPDQYVATDKRTGFEVQVTGDFPEHPDDRMRIARTTTLFTRLISTLLQRDESTRRMGFRAIETQLELADALIRQDHSEVQRLIRETLGNMGIGMDALSDLADRLADASQLDPSMKQELRRALGIDPDAEGDSGDEPIEIEAALDPKVLEEIRSALAGIELPDPPAPDDELEPDPPAGSAEDGGAEAGDGESDDDSGEPPLAGAGRA